MYFEILTILFFAIAYAVKGGSMNIFKNWDTIRSRSALLDRLMDGKVLSTMMVFVYAIIAGSQNLLSHEYLVAALPLAWLASVSPSMGEEQGSIGDYKGALATYLERAITFRGRSYDFKKALQRGVWMGACFALALNAPYFILFSLLFIPVVWIGQSLNRLILKEEGWAIAEPLIGGIIIGLPVALFLN